VHSDLAELATIVGRLALCSALATFVLGFGVWRLWRELRTTWAELHALSRHVTKLAELTESADREAHRRIGVVRHSVERDVRLIHERLQELTLRGGIPPITLSRPPPPLVPDDGDG